MDIRYDCPCAGAYTDTYQGTTMAETPNFISDLALILIVAGAVTILFKKLRQPLVLGYVVAGFIVSPHMPYTMSVIDSSSVGTWADIGVMFLLFSLGLDFSFKKIMKMGASPVISTCTIIFCMMTLGIIVGHSFGWKRMDCIFLGGMLAMSSTTIIYKAFNDMGLRQQKFTGSVMSVLILEDILAIVMMVMLSAIAVGSGADGEQMVGSIAKIVFFLILWFVVGIALVPLFLRSVRRLVNDETLLIVSLGLCCLMAVLSTKVGFSSAFGAFVMGSIISETIEADKIERLVSPVKDLFGAIFFVSVGMLVDPAILVEYALPIVVLVITILVGQAVFGTLGFMLGGQSLKSAMRCGFSMAQIGEFSFIIASLGLSLGVTGHFLYPVVVAVSVITTFLTPYMIKLSVPCYGYVERHLPENLINTLNNISMNNAPAQESKWKRLITQMAFNTLVYSILSTACIVLMFTFFLPFIRKVMPGMHWWANGICGLLTVFVISPFLRAMIMKKNHSKEFVALWHKNRMNRFPLIFTILVRAVIAIAFLFYICNYLSRFTNALMISLATAMVMLMVVSRRLKKRSIRMEKMFVQNLRSREIEAQVLGMRKPLYEGRLLDRDVHISASYIKRKKIEIERDVDELTQIYNRNGLKIKINKLLEDKNIAQYALIFIDLDDLKQVNDVYGHYCGDLYLKQMTNVLKTISGEKCLVGRLGGDEFIAFFHHYDSMEKLNNDINQLNEIRDQIVLLADDHSVNLAFSYGVCYGTESTDLQRMIEIADYKMYENKRKRKGR